MARTAISAYDISANALTGRAWDANKIAGRADSGHKILNNGDLIFLVTKTTSTGDITFPTPATAGDGKDPIADRAYTIDNTETMFVCGPFEPSIFNTDGYLHIDYETGEETEFSILPIKMVAAR